MYYSSKLKEHKSVFGAIKQKQEITYRVFAPYSQRVDILIRKGENSPYFYYELKDEFQTGWFELTTSFEDVGVYFYHFEIYYDRHKQAIFRGEDMADLRLLEHFGKIVGHGVAYAGIAGAFDITGCEYIPQCHAVTQREVFSSLRGLNGVHASA